MSNERKVRISFPGGGSIKEMNTSASTWGDLKKEITQKFGEEFYNQKVRDYHTNAQYATDSEALPAQDLDLLVSTDKNKSGR